MSDSQFPAETAPDDTLPDETLPDETDGVTTEGAATERANTDGMNEAPDDGPDQAMGVADLKGIQLPHDPTLADDA